MKKINFRSNPYIIKNENYSTVTYKLIYPFTYCDGDLVNLKLMKQLLCNYNKNYKDEIEFK